jgi:molybdenum cofactor cytidylyltransferase
LTRFRAAVLLAAGHGGRMGGPKARLCIDGRPLLLHHVERIAQLGIERVVAVVHPREASRIALSGIVLALSEAADQAGSLAVGVRALGVMDAEDALLVTPVDALPPNLDVHAALAAALDAGARAATPVFGGRGGHPVACRFAELAVYAAPGPHPPLRARLGAMGDSRARVTVADRAIAGDLDTPEDVRALTGMDPTFVERIDLSAT